MIYDILILVGHLFCFCLTLKIKTSTSEIICRKTWAEFEIFYSFSPIFVVLGDLQGFYNFLLPFIGKQKCLFYLFFFFSCAIIQHRRKNLFLIKKNCYIQNNKLFLKTDDKSIFQLLDAYPRTFFNTVPYPAPFFLCSIIPIFPYLQILWLRE